MQKTSLAAAKANLSRLVDQAEQKGQRTIVLRHGVPAAAMALSSSRSVLDASVAVASLHPREPGHAEARQARHRDCVGRQLADSR